MSPWPFLLLIGLSTVVGCQATPCTLAHGPNADCSYGAVDAHATVWFENATWSADNVSRVLSGAGFATDAELGHLPMFVGTSRGNITITVQFLPNGSVLLHARVVPTPQGDSFVTQPEANAVLDGTAAAATPLVERALAALERELGWTRGVPLHWENGLVVA